MFSCRDGSIYFIGLLWVLNENVCEVFTRVYSTERKLIVIVIIAVENEPSIGKLQINLHFDCKTRIWEREEAKVFIYPYLLPKG